VRVTVGRVLADGDQGAAEWTWRERLRDDGSRRTYEDALIFELRDGQLVYWREYFDPAAWR
jgi:ketosteroid isomerase-like protein